MKNRCLRWIIERLLRSRTPQFNLKLTDTMAWLDIERDPNRTAILTCRMQKNGYCRLQLQTWTLPILPTDQIRVITLALPYQTNIPLDLFFLEDSFNSNLSTLLQPQSSRIMLFLRLPSMPTIKLSPWMAITISIGTDSVSICVILTAVYSEVQLFQRLYCIRHFSGDTWNLYDITPNSANTTVLCPTSPRHPVQNHS